MAGSLADPSEPAMVVKKAVQKVQMSAEKKGPY
jgi:hypothetical protein